MILYPEEYISSEGRATPDSVWVKIGKMKIPLYNRAI